MYWACAQLEPQRSGLALHCLGLNGFEVYCPKVREQRRVNGRSPCASRQRLPDAMKRSVGRQD
jgi:hypothetical protein